MPPAVIARSTCDEAIHFCLGPMDCFRLRQGFGGQVASLAMTGGGIPGKTTEIWGRALAAPTTWLSSPRRRGSSTPRLLDSIIGVSGILGRPPQCAIAHKADDDTGYGFAISRHDLPELYKQSSPSPIRGRRECRVRAAPAVSCAFVVGNAHTSIQGSGEHPTFPAQWLYGL